MQFYQRVSYTDYTNLSPRESPAMAKNFRASLIEGRPVVFFFPGVQTTDTGVIRSARAMDSLNYKSHFVERHLGGGGIYKTGLQFYALTYSDEARTWYGGSWMQHRYGRAGDARSFLSRPNDYFSHDANLWVENLLLPALKDDQGQWASLPEMKRRLQHLTLFGDSYGSIFAEQIANCLKTKMTKAGFAPGDIAAVQRSIVLVAASNIPRRTSDANDYQVGHYTGIYLEGNDDHFIHGSRPNGWHHMKHMGQSMLFKNNRPVKDADYTPEWLKGFELDDTTPSQQLPFPMHESDMRDDRMMPLPPLDESSLAFTRVVMNRGRETEVAGIKVTFDVPQNYTLRVRVGPERRLLQWHNREKHQSGSYYVMGDQQHVVARALRNAVRLGMEGKPRTPEALLNTRAMPIVCHPNWEAWETGIQDRMDALLPERLKGMVVDDTAPPMYPRRALMGLPRDSFAGREDARQPATGTRGV